MMQEFPFNWDCNPNKQGFSQEKVCLKFLKSSFFELHTGDIPQKKDKNNRFSEKQSNAWILGFFKGFVLGLLHRLMKNVLSSRWCERASRISQSSLSICT